MLLSSTSQIMESGTCECLKEKKKDVALYICHTMWMIFNIWDEKWRHSAVYVYDYYHFIFLFPRDLHSQTKWIWTLFHNNFLSPPSLLPPMLLIAKWMFLCHLADQLWEGLGIRWSYKYVWECRCLKLQSFFWQIGTFISHRLLSVWFDDNSRLRDIPITDLDRRHFVPFTSCHRRSHSSSWSYWVYRWIMGSNSQLPHFCGWETIRGGSGELWVTTFHKLNWLQNKMFLWTRLHS